MLPKYDIRVGKVVEEVKKCNAKHPLPALVKRLLSRYLQGALKGRKSSNVRRSSPK